MSTPKMNIKSGDTVMVLSGVDKGKQGKVQKAYPVQGKVIVQGIRMVKRHQKPRGQGMQGGIIEKEAAIPVSNVMLVCPKCGKPTRVAHKFIEGEGKLSRRKVRVCKRANCGATLDN